MIRLTADKTEAPVWAREDTQIKMDIGAWLAATGKRLEDLAMLCGISRGTMYSRYKHPGDFSLDEARRLYRVMERVLKARGAA